MALVFENSVLQKVFGDDFAQIATLNITLLQTESHRHPVELTKRPVQSGAVLTDSARVLPVSVSVQAIVTDERLGSTWQEKHEAIIALKNAREPFAITTSLGAYENMFFDGDIVFNRDATTKNHLAFSCTFTEVNLIQSRTTQIPPEALQQPAETSPSQNAGKQQGETSNGETTGERSSLLLQAGQYFGVTN